jgi:hypothetical protein
VSRNPAGDGCSVAGGLAGWCRGVLSAGFSAADATSGLASPCTATSGGPCFFARQLSSGEGRSLSIASGGVCDIAGNCSAGITAGPFRRDVTAPVIERDPTRDACSLHGALGWCRGTLLVAFDARDNAAGIGSACMGGDGSSSPCKLAPVQAIGEGPAIDVGSPDVCDLAGNCTPGVHVAVKVDTHGPFVQVAESCSLPLTSGWCRGTLAAVFTVSDAISGIGPVCPAPSGVECSFSQSLTGEGRVYANHPELCDVAGNCFHQDSWGPFTHDTKPPLIASGDDHCDLSGLDGWCRYRLFAGFTTADATSGIAAPISCPNETTCRFSRLVTDEGIVSVSSGPICDVAGNCNPGLTRNGFRFDATDPTLSPQVGPLPILLRGTAAATPGATDGTSGIASQSCGPVTTSTAGVHTITCTAKDLAGNTATASIDYVVEYKILGVLSPAAGASLRAGTIVPVRIALADAHGVRITQAEAQGLAGRTCRIEVDVTGAQTANGCMSYDTVNREFVYDWQLDRSIGAAAIQLVIHYPGSASVTTIGEDLVITG